MPRLLIVLLLGTGLAVTGCATQQRTASPAPRPATPMTKDTYDLALRNAETQGRIDRDACALRSGNSKDICMAEASGREKVAKAEAEAAYRNSPKAREDVREARAEATYNISKEKCDDLAGNPKDVCVKEAEAALVRARADARVDRIDADARQDAATKQADARQQASQEKRDADYKVALEKCDVLAGAAKTACINDAKLRYGKS